MYIKYKQYEITEDRNSFILTEYGVVPEKNNKGEVNKTAGSTVVVDQCYPSTLEACLLKISHRERRNKKEAVALGELAATLKEMNEEFINNIKELCLQMTE